MSVSIIATIWVQVVALKPAFMSKSPHFNFITVHYFWIMGMAILGSIMLYPRSNLSYIDALFHASGAATQSGLNTVNLNDMNTWQQLVLYWIPTCCNPITINTFVVFLRLYWFEKRFRHITRQAKLGRKTFSKSKSQARNDRDIEREEMGVNGRKITVMHNTTRANAGGANDGDENLQEHMAKRALSQEKEKSGSGSGGDSNKSSGSEGHTLVSAPTHQTQVTFADNVKRGYGQDEETLRMPIQRSEEEHIKFLQRQRNPDDNKVLRIPGPRDADRGIAPEAVDDNDGIHQTNSRAGSGLSSVHDSEDLGEADPNAEQPERKKNITIAEPHRPVTEHIVEDASAAKNTLDIFKFRKRPRVVSGTNHHEEKDNIHPLRTRTNTFATLRRALTSDKDQGMPYLSWEATVGRNSAFVDLTEDQREELGGIEYRSLKSLAMILVSYFWGFSIFGVVCLTPWIYNSSYAKVVTGDGQGRAWWGIFTANSAFTDLGYTLTPDSMISFNTAIWPLLLMSFLIIIGNTGFPIMLRIIIWVTSKWVPKDSGIWEELKFLLDHPRRCFTLLFPAQATWWLFWILVVLNGLDLIFFIVLDLGNTVITGLPVHVRLLDGWFQAVSTRTAGFAVVNLSALHPAIQVSYLIMMYISVLPIAISVRRTNVYEEKSLGIYGSQDEENEDESEPSYVGAHLRRQLSFDLWFIFAGFFIISISEGKRIQNDPNFTMFNILFEIVSAYGTVGLSLGYPNIDASLSAEFGVIAKLIIIAMQIRGRHRGLPYELDRAILLPSENLHKKEAEDAELRIRRRSSTMNVADNDGTASIASGNARLRNRSMSNKPDTPGGNGQKGSNLLGTLLHPGPTIPNNFRQHRYTTSNATDSSVNRRNSIAVASVARGRHPDARSISPGQLDSLPEGRTERRASERRTSRASNISGRRTFFQEGMNT